MHKKDRSAVLTFAWHLVSRHPARMAVTVVSMTAVSLAQGMTIALLIPLFSIIGLGGDSPLADQGMPIRWITRAIEASGLKVTLETVLALFLLFMVAESLLRFFQRSFAQSFLRNFGADLRVTLYDAYLKASWQFWLKNQIGNMSSNLTREVERVQEGFHNFTRFLSEAITAAVLLWVAFSLSWQFTLAALGVGTALLLIMKGLFSSGHRIGTDVSDHNTAMYQAVNEQLNAAKVIKSSAMERQSLGIFAQSVFELKEAEIRGNIGGYRLPAIFRPIIGVMLCLGLYIALTYLNINPAEALVLLFIFYRISLHATNLQESWYLVLLYTPAYSKILGDLEEANQSIEQIPSQNLAVCPALSQSLEIEGATFSYVPEVPVIRKVGLYIPAGKTVALAGESGSGKSTLLDLIVGLVKPQEGDIRVDQVGLVDIDLSSWRAQVGYVGQETILFNDSIRNNIRWANPQATDSAIEDAARLAYAHDFISAMPDGYSTIIGNRGIRLSGGERQRIALARALVRRPRLLILDEATSALDAASEKVVQEAIDSLTGQTTIIIVAHRLATVRNADWIYVLERGQIVQEGTWDHLTREPGQFYALWSLQNGVTRASHSVGDS